MREYDIEICERCRRRRCDCGCDDRRMYPEQKVIVVEGERRVKEFEWNPYLPPPCPCPIPGPPYPPQPPYNKEGWAFPVNYAFSGPNLKGDVALTAITPIYQDGLYQINIAGATKIVDPGANASFAPTLNFTEVAAGASTLSITLDLRTIPSGPITATTTTLLLAGSMLTLIATGSGLTVGQYDLFVSVLKLA